MSVPAADFGERHFDAHIRLDQARDLLQALAESAAGILRSIRRRVALLLDRLHDLDRAESLLAGPVQNGVERMVVHALESRRGFLIAHLKIVQIVDRDGVVASAQRTRKAGA